jgi:GNAT superfamily N-acetyltransferase
MSEANAAYSRPVATTVFFDPQRASEAEWRDALAYWRQRSAEDFPDEPLASDAETRHGVLQGAPLYVIHRVLALDEHGKPVGSLNMGIRRAGTPDYESFAPFVDVWGGVLRSHQRRGVASTLLGALLAFMATQGKTTATVKAHLPEGHAFLRAIGAQERHRSIENRATFAGLDWQALSRWEAEGFAPAHGLRAEFHVGRVPVERLAELLPALSTLLNDAPTSALERAPMRYEMAEYLAWYAEIDRRGGEHYLVLLLDGDEVVAVCDASWNQLFPDRMFQRLTAVARHWRGRGLAKGVKAAMLRLVHSRHPELALISTSNAEVNAPMLAINRQLGFVVHRQEGLYQFGTDSLRAYLATRSMISRESRA